MGTRTKTNKKNIKAVNIQTVLPPALPHRKKADGHLIALVGIIICVALIRLQLVDVPLERDEGEYAYIGKLILQGIAPYKEAYNMKLPGTYMIYALIMLLLGKTTGGIHYGLLLINAATTTFLFLAFRKLFNARIALFASTVYAFMSLSPNVLGFAAHATHFVTFFSSMGLYFLAFYLDHHKARLAFFMGLMFGLSFLMKQQAVFFILFGGSIILSRIIDKPTKYKSILSHGLLYSAGALLPYIITVIALKLAGAFDKFWFWTVEYASKYASGLTLKEGKAMFNYSFNPLWQEFTFLWILFCGGFIALFFTSFSVKQKLTALLFSFFAFLTVCPGFYFRQHYFICFLPAVGLLGGITLEVLSTLLSNKLKARAFTSLSLVLLPIIIISILSKNKEYYIHPEPEQISRSVYGTNPFIEAPEIANYIKANSNKSDQIAVLGSEPEIYFYSDRRAATGHIYTYGLMELHKYNKTMQEEMISEIEKNKPTFLVFCSISTSWLRRPESPKRIFEWYNTYVTSKYEIKGIVDISNEQTFYKWNEAATTYQLKGNQNIFVFRRKQGI